MEGKALQDVRVGEAKGCSDKHEPKREEFRWRLSMELSSPMAEGPRPLL